MDFAEQDFDEALAQLAWQVELGADEAIGEKPVNRYEQEVKAKEAAKVVETLPEPVVMAKVDMATQAAHLAAQCADLHALRAALEAFDGCPLKRGARNMVFADGNPAAHVMVIGGSPGREEDRTGKPFIGKSGQLLDKMLAAIGLSRMAEASEEAVYITNVIPWYPPQDRDVTDEERAMMLPFLRRHIALVKPRILLLVGNPSNQSLLASNLGVSKLRGQWHSIENTPALSIYHPAYLLRAPAKKREAWADLLTLKAKLNEA